MTFEYEVQVISFQHRRQLWRQQISKCEIFFSLNSALQAGLCARGASF